MSSSSQTNSPQPFFSPPTPKTTKKANRAAACSSSELFDELCCVLMGEPQPPFDDFATAQRKAKLNIKMRKLGRKMGELRISQPAFDSPEMNTVGPAENNRNDGQQQ